MQGLSWVDEGWRALTPETVRASALLLMAADFVFEHHGDAESGLAWARKIENSVENDPLWAEGMHSGDCTKQPHTCSRCFLENYEHLVRETEDEGLEYVISDWLKERGR